MEGTRVGGVAPRRWVATTVAVAGLAASLTGVFLAMRKVMDIGGSCADGGPDVVGIVRVVGRVLTGGSRPTVRGGSTQERGVWLPPRCRAAR